MLATLQVIADKLECSKSKISLALCKLTQVPQGTNEKIQQAASKLGYRPNASNSQSRAELRSSHKSKFQAELAPLSANDEPNAFTSHPTIPINVLRCYRRASRLSCSFDSFWIQETSITAKRLIRIFKTRNIKYPVVVGLMGVNQLTSPLNPLWECFPIVASEVGTRPPPLSTLYVDHHKLKLRAIERLVGLGYKRPTLALDDSINLLVERRVSAGLEKSQLELEDKNSSPPFLKYKQTKVDPQIFKSWILDSKPDINHTLYNSVSSWIQEVAWQVLGNIGFALLERRHESPQFSRMD